MNNKIVYVITTYKCSACKCIEYILKDIQKDNTSFTVETIDCFDVPDFIKNNITLTDFPTVVFVENNDIKYHFVGTLSEKKINKIINNIGF